MASETGLNYINKQVGNKVQVKHSCGCVSVFCSNITNIIPSSESGAIKSHISFKISLNKKLRKQI